MSSINILTTIANTTIAKNNKIIRTTSISQQFLNRFSFIFC